MNCSLAVHGFLHELFVHWLFMDFLMKCSLAVHRFLNELIRSDGQILPPTANVPVMKRGHFNFLLLHTQ